MSKLRVFVSQKGSSWLIINEKIWDGVFLAVLLTIRSALTLALKKQFPPKTKNLSSFTFPYEVPTSLTLLLPWNTKGRSRYTFIASSIYNETKRCQFLALHLQHIIVWFDWTTLEQNKAKMTSLMLHFELTITLSRFTNARTNVVSHPVTLKVALYILQVCLKTSKVITLNSDPHYSWCHLDVRAWERNQTFRTLSTPTNPS